MAPISVKIKIPKESIKTHKVTNTPNLISQLEPSSPKEIMVNSKMRTDVSIFPDKWELVLRNKMYSKE